MTLPIRILRASATPSTNGCAIASGRIFSAIFSRGRIKTAELGARYGVSQMPIREALQQLQGIITIAPTASVHRGCRLHPQIYDIRGAWKPCCPPRRKSFD
jgi:hypothetical protein